VQEEPASGQIVFAIVTDPTLDSPAACTVTGELPNGRKWVFSFRDPDDTRRAYAATLGALTAEHRRALRWP
jgi:hypothetical protein